MFWSIEGTGVCCVASYRCSCQLVIKSLKSFRTNYSFAADIVIVIKEIITVKFVFAEHKDSRKVSNCLFFRMASYHCKNFPVFAEILSLQRVTF